MTNVIFSFDTEDYVNPHAADGILRVSKIVREAGFTPRLRDQLYRPREWKG